MATNARAIPQVHREHNDTHQVPRASDLQMRRMDLDWEEVEQLRAALANPPKPTEALRRLLKGKR